MYGTQYTADSGDSSDWSWLYDLRTLTAASVLGVSLKDDPTGFVMAVIVDWFIGGIIDLVGELAATSALAWGVAADAYVTAQSEVAGSFGIVGDAIIDALTTVNSTIVMLSINGGPLSPLLIIVMWSVIGLGLAILLRTLLEAIQWI